MKIDISEILTIFSTLEKVLIFMDKLTPREIELVEKLYESLNDNNKEIIKMGYYPVFKHIEEQKQEG